MSLTVPTASAGCKRARVGAIKLSKYRARWIWQSLSVCEVAFVETIDLHPSKQSRKRSAHVPSQPLPLQSGEGEVPEEQDTDDSLERALEELLAMDGIGVAENDNDAGDFVDGVGGLGPEDFVLRPDGQVGADAEFDVPSDDVGIGSAVYGQTVCRLAVPGGTDVDADEDAIVRARLPAWE